MKNKGIVIGIALAIMEIWIFYGLYLVHDSPEPLFYGLAVFFTTLLTFVIGLAMDDNL